MPTVTAVALFVSVFADASSDPEALLERLSEPPAQVSDVLGETGVQAIRRSRRIVVVPLEGSASRRPLPRPLVAELKQTLLDRRSYRGRALGKLCGDFSPALEVEFASNGQRPFQLLVSFSCNEMRVRRGDGSVDASIRVDFAPAADRLADLLQVPGRCSVPVSGATAFDDRALFTCSCPPPPPSDWHEEVLGAGTHRVRVCAAASCDPKQVCRLYEALQPERFRTGCQVVAAPIPFAALDGARRVACLNNASEWRAAERSRASNTPAGAK